MKVEVVGEGEEEGEEGEREGEGEEEEREGEGEEREGEGEEEEGEKGGVGDHRGGILRQTPWRRKWKLHRLPMTLQCKPGKHCPIFVAGFLISRVEK